MRKNEKSEFFLRKQTDRLFKRQKAQSGGVLRKKNKTWNELLATGGIMYFDLLEGDVFARPNVNRMPHTAR